MDINEKEFKAYEAVRASGVTNMFDLNTVSQLSGLDRQKINAIMKDYGDLKKAYLGDD